MVPTPVSASDLADGRDGPISMAAWAVVTVLLISAIAPCMGRHQPSVRFLINSKNDVWIFEPANHQRPNIRRVPRFPGYQAPRLYQRYFTSRSTSDDSSKVPRSCPVSGDPSAISLDTASPGTTPRFRGLAHASGQIRVRIVLTKLRLR